MGLGKIAGMLSLALLLSATLRAQTTLPFAQATVLVNSATSTGPSPITFKRQIFATSDSGALFLQIQPTGIFTALTFNLEITDGTNWNTLSSWDSVANPSTVLFLPVNVTARLNCKTFAGGTSVSVLGSWGSGSPPGASSGAGGNVTVTNFPATQPVTPPAITKGSQGANGVTTQDLKDAGRVIKVFSASFSATTTEALVTLTPITDGTAGTTGTSFTVTAGKRLRVQSFAMALNAPSTTAVGGVVNLRMTASGAVAANSPLVATTGCGLAGTQVAQNGCSGHVIFPDGLELSGTQQFGISQKGIASAGFNVTLVAYEY